MTKNIDEKEWNKIRRVMNDEVEIRDVKNWGKIGPVEPICLDKKYYKIIDEFFKCPKCDKTRFNAMKHPSKFKCKNCGFVLHLNLYFKEDGE